MRSWFAFLSIMYIRVFCSCRNDYHVANPETTVFAVSLYNLLTNQSAESSLDSNQLPDVIKQFYCREWEPVNFEMKNPNDDWSPATCFGTGMMVVCNKQGDTLYSYTPEDSSDYQLRLFLKNPQNNEYLVVYQQKARQAYCNIDLFKITGDGIKSKILSHSAAVTIKQIVGLKELIDVISNRKFIVVPHIEKLLKNFSI